MLTIPCNCDALRGWNHVILTCPSVDHHDIYVTSTRFRRVLQQRRFPFTLNEVMSSYAELHCGLRCSRWKLRLEKFNFSSVDGSTSQSNHMPVQALANQTVCLCVRGGRLMWLLVAHQSRPPASFNATEPCGRTDTRLVVILGCLIYTSGYLVHLWCICWTLSVICAFAFSKVTGCS